MERTFADASARAARLAAAAARRCAAAAADAAASGSDADFARAAEHAAAAYRHAAAAELLRQCLTALRLRSDPATHHGRPSGTAPPVEACAGDSSETETTGEAAAHASAAQAYSATATDIAPS